MRGGVARRRTISRDEFLGIEIPFPTLDEQKRISAVLDKADALRRQRQESLQLTEKLLQSIFIDMFGEPEAMPQKRFAQLLIKPLRNGLSPASGGLHNDTVFTLSAITRGYFNSSARKEAVFAAAPRPAARVSATDFLICRGNGNLRLCGKGQFPTDDAVGVVFPDTIIAASIDLQQVAKAYFETLWNQPFVRRQIESGARTANGIHKVNQTTLEEIKIPLPDFKEQVAFGKIAESMVATVKGLEASAEHMESLFSSLQQRAFRGELDVNKLAL
jgi:type I restriction enzyme S subunit